MSSQHAQIYVGVDVANKHLDLFFPDSGKSERIKNDTNAIDSLCDRMANKDQYMFVMEASGGYESLLCAHLGKKKIAHAVVNARVRSRPGH